MYALLSICTIVNCHNILFTVVMVNYVLVLRIKQCQVLLCILQYCKQWYSSGAENKFSLQ